MEKVKKLLKARELTSLVFLIALFVIVGAMNPMFLDPSNVSACFNSSVVYTLVAVGMAFVLFIGEIAVSVGANLGLTAAVVGTMLRDGQSLVLAIIVAIVIGIVIGLINGWGVCVMGAPSLIFTLGVNGGKDLLFNSIHGFEPPQYGNKGRQKTAPIFPEIWFLFRSSLKRN